VVDGKGGHQPLTQGRHISVILAEEKVGRRSGNGNLVVDGKGGHQPLTQGRHFSVILADEKRGVLEKEFEVATIVIMKKEIGLAVSIHLRAIFVGCIS